jgi:hypothetical protein
LYHSKLFQQCLPSSKFLRSIWPLTLSNANANLMQGLESIRLHRTLVLTQPLKPLHPKQL